MDLDRIELRSCVRLAVRDSEFWIFLIDSMWSEVEDRHFSLSQTDTINEVSTKIYSTKSPKPIMNLWRLSSLAYFLLEIKINKKTPIMKLNTNGASPSEEGQNGQYRAAQLRRQPFWNAIYSSSLSSMLSLHQTAVPVCYPWPCRGVKLPQYRAKRSLNRHAWIA